MMLATDGIKPPAGELYPFVLQPEDIPVAWDRIRPFIERSCEKSRGTVTVEQIKEMLDRGVATVIGTSRDDTPVLISVIRVVTYGNYSVGRIISLSGKGLKESMEYIDVLEVWAFSQGAIELEGWCRPGAARLLKKLGWSHKFSIMSWDLRRKLQ